MRVSGRVGWLLVALLTLVLVGCSGTAAPADPSGSLGPSASPLASLDPDEILVCEAMLVMESGLARVQSVKLRAGARNRLDQAMQSVLTGQDALLQAATFRMRTRVQSVKLRAGARNRLDQAVQSVLTGQDALLQTATYRMRTRIRTLGIAITNLVLAAEDFRTTTYLSAAAANVKRASKDLRKAIDSFQRWVGCGALVLPTPTPGASPSASLVPYDSPEPSVQG